MDRAKVVQDGSVPANVVRMGSTVTFKSDDGNTRTFKLVYPAEESLDEHRISVMTPVGAALIGLAEGQSISWTARDGRKHELTVEKVKTVIADRGLRPAHSFWTASLRLAHDHDAGSRGRPRPIPRPRDYGR